jgi:hypothetical protein
VISSKEAVLVRLFGKSSTRIREKQRETHLVSMRDERERETNKRVRGTTKQEEEEEEEAEATTAAATAITKIAFLFWCAC